MAARLHAARESKQAKGCDAGTEVALHQQNQNINRPGQGKAQWHRPRMYSAVGHSWRITTGGKHHQTLQTAQVFCTCLLYVKPVGVDNAGRSK